jgi:hypothetical protein
MSVKISIPTSLNDLTLGQYQNYLRVENPTNEDMLECFLGLNKDSLYAIADKDFDMLIAHLNDIFDADHNTFLTKFELDGVKYGAIPNFDDITYGENKDITYFINDWEQMHNAMSVIYRPIEQEVLGKYRIEEYTNLDRAEQMKQMPLGIAFSCLVFFCNLTKELLKCIPNYLEEEMEKEMGLVAPVNSQVNGIVIKNLLRSLTETSLDLQRLVDYPYINA